MSGATKFNLSVEDDEGGMATTGVSMMPLWCDVVVVAALSVAVQAQAFALAA